MITLTYSRLSTYSQDDTLLNEVEQTGSEILTGGLNKISERKKLYCTFDVETVPEPEEGEEAEEQMTLAGSKLFVSFALFLPSGLAVDYPNAVPNTGFSLVIPSDIYEVAGDAIEMPFYSLGVTTPHNARNYKCYFYFLTETSFAVELEYYNTFDEDAYMNSVSKSNQWRFFSDYWDQNNTNEVTDSVYMEAKELRMISHLIREELTEDGLKYTETQEHRLYSGTIESYDQSEFLNLDDESLESISSVYDTPITARIYVDEDTADKFYAKLVRISNNSDVDFIENYELQETLLEDGGEPTPGENAFIGPVVIDWNEDDNYYQLEFSINPDFVEDGVTYRVIIVAYNEGGVDYEGASIGIGTSGPIPATSVSSYCDMICSDEYDFPTSLIFTPTLADVENEYSGNFLTCCIEERMRSKLIVDYSDDRWKNSLKCRKYGTFTSDTGETNDIRIHLKSVDFEIYEEYYHTSLLGTVKHVLDLQTATKSAPNQYTTSSSNLSFTVDTTTEQITMYYDWRNRNEINSSNLFSYLNGQLCGNFSNQYWGGRSLFIKWTLNFDYWDFKKPFTESLYIIQKIVVRDYDTNIVVTNDFDLDFVCPEETLCFDAAIILATPEDYKLINIFELSPGLLYEKEAWVPSILSQQTSTYFNNQDQDYTGGDAHFCVDPSTLNVNQTYNFTTLAKRT